MRNILLLLLTFASTSFAIDLNQSPLGITMSLMSTDYTKPNVYSLDDIKNMLQEEKTLNPDVINKTLSTMACADKNNIWHNNILSIIDYSLPSSEKRLWIFDLNNKKLMLHTYVSHGIKSGFNVTNNFSNKNNSRASSIGVYKTKEAYYGREGMSLRLTGLDRGFNDNAENRAIVMHGGWYVEEDFIKKYGRAGRSWGCPAVPKHLAKQIIDLIKDSSVFIAYYPNDGWFKNSKFLQCSVHNSIAQKKSFLPSWLTSITDNLNNKPENETRDPVLLIDNSNKKRLDEKSIVAMPADIYTNKFNNKPPLTRMLRRQVNGVEFIALSHNEFNNLSEQKQMDNVYFITPEIKVVRGYYETVMKITNLGKIKDVIINANQARNYTVLLENNKMINLKITDQFIRWLGL